MTRSKKKEKRVIPLRNSGEPVVQPGNRPSKVLFDRVMADEKLSEISSEEISLSSIPTTYHHHLPPPTTNQEVETSISPKRDYTKVANSIARDAVPSGLFKGTSKNTYDALYLRTRGAINPVKKIKAVQSDLLIWSNVSHNTLRAHLKHLGLIGLVRVHYILGDNKGAEYEVFLPEEIGIDPKTMDYLLLPPPTPSYQNMVGGTTQKLVGGGSGFMPENIDPNDIPKTSLKTNIKSDDEKNEIFSDFIENFQAAAKKITGKNLSKYEKEKWGQLAELLISELEVAAGRAAQVSSIPAFLTEILRRRLFVGRELERNEKPSVRKRGEVGEANSAYNGIESLTELEKERLIGDLSELKSFCETEEQFEAEYKKWYSDKEWSWVTSNLQE